MFFFLSEKKLSQLKVVKRIAHKMFSNVKDFTFQKDTGRDYEKEKEKQLFSVFLELKKGRIR